MNPTNDKEKKFDGMAILQLVIQTSEIVLLCLLCYLIVRLSKDIAHMTEQLESQHEAPAAQPKTFDPYQGAIQIENSPIQGDLAQASIALIEFSDFECDYCRTASSDVTDLLQARSGIARVHKDFPLIYHAAAKPAAVAARCAGEQEKYWEYYEKLYALPEIRSDRFEALAKELNLDMEAFQSCLSDPIQLERVQQDFDEGVALKVDGTPTFLIGKISEMSDRALTISGVFCKAADLDDILETLCESGNEDACASL